MGFSLCLQEFVNVKSLSERHFNHSLYQGFNRSIGDMAIWICDGISPYQPISK